MTWKICPPREIFVVTLSLLAWLGTSCAPVIKSETLFRLYVATTGDSTFFVKNPFGENDVGITVEGRTEIYSFDASEPLTQEKLIEVAQQIRDRIDGFLSGHELYRRYGWPGVKEHSVQPPQSVRFVDDWHHAVSQGMLQASRELRAQGRE